MARASLQMPNVKLLQNPLFLPKAAGKKTLSSWRMLWTVAPQGLGVGTLDGGNPVLDLLDLSCAERYFFARRMEAQGLGKNTTTQLGKSLFVFFFCMGQASYYGQPDFRCWNPKACTVNPNDGRPNGLRRRITCLGGFKKKQVRMGRLQNRESRWKKLHKLLANSTVEVVSINFFRSLGVLVAPFKVFIKVQILLTVNQ